jgi:hypothetical protein
MLLVVPADSESAEQLEAVDLYQQLAPECALFRLQ